jgi:hypothetical protein
MEANAERQTLPTREEVLQRQWWKRDDVMVYMGFNSPEITKNWMWRKKVRRSKTDRRFTCKEWVDAAMERKSQMHQREPHADDDRPTMQELQKPAQNFTEAIAARVPESVAQ